MLHPTPTIVMKAVFILTVLSIASLPPVERTEPNQQAVVAPRPEQLPDTPIGKRTAAFLSAFSAGVDSMTRFVDEQMTPTSQPARQRAEASMQMRDRVGKVTFKQVLSATDTKLVIVAESEKAGLLRITTEVEGVAPYRMLPRPDFNPYR
jgi:hypothetical protein